MPRTASFRPEEDEIIRTSYRDLFDDELAAILNRPVGSVTRRRQRLGCWYVQQELSAPLKGEAWASLGIDGNHYQISSMGRIKAGKKLAALFIDRAGYVRWRIVNVAKGLAVSISVHRKVAEVFCERPEGWSQSWEVHHIDRNPQNNRADNLVWLSPEDHRKVHQ